MNRFKLSYLLLILLPMLFAGFGSYFAGAEISSKGFSLFHLSVGVAFLCGLISLVSHYQKSRHSLIITFFATLVFTAVMIVLMRAPISLLSLFMANLLFVFLNYLFIYYIFYHKDLYRIRTLFMGLCGGFLFALYIPYLYGLIGRPQKASFSTFFIFGLIVYVFIGFSLSIADLAIIKDEVGELRQKLKELPDPEEDA